MVTVLSVSEAELPVAESIASGDGVVVGRGGNLYRALPDVFLSGIGGVRMFNTRTEATLKDTGSASFIFIGDLLYAYDVDGTALTTGDDRTWSPFSTIRLEHWQENATPGTTDMQPALAAAIAWLDDVGGSALNQPNTGCIELEDQEYYFATGCEIPNTLDGLHIQGRGKGSIMSTDQNIVLLNVGPSLSGGGDTASSAPTYGTKLTNITFVNRKMDSTNVALQMNRCPNTEVTGCTFVNWYIAIDGHRWNQSFLNSCQFYNNSRTTNSPAHIRLQGVYDSSNSHTPGGGLHFWGVELIGNPADKTKQEACLLVHAVDGLYLHSGHTKESVYGLKVMPDGSAQNRVITDIFHGGSFYYDDPAENGINVYLTGTVGPSSMYQSIWLDGVKARGSLNANYGVLLSVTDAGGFTNKLGDIHIAGGEIKQHRIQGVRIEGAADGKVPAEVMIGGVKFSDGNVGGAATTSYIHADGRIIHITDNVFGPEANAAARAVFVTVETDGDSVILSDNDFSGVTSTEAYVIRRSALGRVTISNNNPKGGSGEFQRETLRKDTTGFDPTIVWEFDFTQNNQLLDVTFKADGSTTDTNNNHAYFEYRFAARRDNSGAVSQIVKTIVASGHNLTLNNQAAGIGILTGTAWTSGMSVAVGDWVTSGGNVYAVIESDGTAGTTAPSHTSGAASDGGVRYLYLGAVDVSKVIAYISGETSGANKLMNWQAHVQASAVP